MKTLKSITCLILLSLVGLTVVARDNKEEKLNLPGDNLNLFAVMNLFRDSETLEDFEKNLNAEDSKINNLDLNGDDKIDYIKVFDYVEGEVHTIVLQVAVNEKENQDVAVFIVQKDDKNQVQVQLIGDEELYGKDYIIEPIYEGSSSVSTPNPGYTGNNNAAQQEKVVVTKTTYVEVASWPVISYIYVPTYVVYRSPWYWGYYPSYWNPWRPYYWDYYYGYHSHYHNHYYGYYHYSSYHRYPYYNDHYYHDRRSYSNTVNQHRQSGMYRNTYSRPDTRSQGSADFMRKYPDGYRPATKSATNTNVNRTTTNPGSGKPAARPATTTPSRDPNVGRPASRPTTTSPSSRPATTNPGTKSGTTRPATSPSSTKSDVKKSVERSSSTIPSVKPNNQPSARPSMRPQNSRPASNPAPSKSSDGTRKSNSKTERSK